MKFILKSVRRKKYNSETLNKIRLKEKAENENEEYIEISNIDELSKIIEEIGQDLIICRNMWSTDERYKTIYIYDDFFE